MDADLMLVPRPQRLQRRGPGAPAGTPVQTRQTDAVRPEGFQLEITPDRVELRHRDPNGQLYGLALLDQIRQQSPGELPGLLVDDWPDFPVRGLMLDVSRDRVPTRATLDRLVDLLALGRFNQLQLYTEHTFAYADHEVVWRDASPITPDDVAWLDQRCRDAGIELVPNQSTFGHMARWLDHADYRDRAEAPDGFELIPGIHRPAGVLAPTQANADFVLGLLDELLPLFAGRRVNVGCDETFELGQGASRTEVEQRGKATVYVDHLLRIVEPLVERGLEVQFWADVLREDPTLGRRLPSGVIPLTWTYAAPPSPGSRGTAAAAGEYDNVEIPAQIRAALAQAGIDPGAHRGFAGNTAPLVEAGLPFWVAPGTSSWLSFVGRLDNALANLADAAEVGLDRGAGGFLLTDWGDNGHHQPPAVSFGPVLYGGAVSWSLAANRNLDLAGVLDRFVFADTSGRLGGALDVLGRAWRRTGQRGQNCSPLFTAFVGQQYLVTGEPDAGKLTHLVEELGEVLTTVDQAASDASDGAVVRLELTAAARLARHGAWRLLAQAGGSVPDRAGLRADLAETLELQREAWLARSRPGGLTDSLARLQPTLDSYR